MPRSNWNPTEFLTALFIFLVILKKAVMHQVHEKETKMHSNEGKRKEREKMMTNNVNAEIPFLPKMSRS
jgi:hypothetical protein